MSQKATEVVAEVIKSKPDCVLGLATGSTPVGMYQRLAKLNIAGKLDFSKVKTYNLDEYYPIKPTDEQSYRFFMNKNLFNNINIDIANTHLLNGEAADAQAECAAYDAAIEAAGGIDIQVLGIGNNGHIGFNEPSSYFTKGTGLVDLTDSTIDANSRFFEKREDVPTQALSMGCGQIMNANKILLIALGKGKAEILEKSLFGDVTPEVPASILQFFKGEVVVCADEEALSVILEKHPEAVCMS